MTELSFRVKWIQTYLLKQESIWTVKEDDKKGSWMQSVLLKKNSNITLGHHVLFVKLKGHIYQIYYFILFCW